MEINRKQSVTSETAVLVGVQLPDNNFTEEPLTELTGLVESAGAQVVGRLTQKRDVPDVATYVGKGKLDQLKQMVGAAEADVIVFDNELAPARCATWKKPPA